MYLHFDSYFFSLFHSLEVYLYPGSHSYSGLEDFALWDYDYD